jgi:Helicase associated domain
MPGNNTGAKPYTTTKVDGTGDLRLLSLRTERNATSTDGDNDRHNLIDHSSGNSEQARWNAMFEKFQEYKTIHGDCLVPSRYKCDDGRRLGLWVANQRRAPRYKSKDGKRRGEQRRHALDSIGFVWIVNERLRQLSPESGRYASAAERFNARWNARFEQLKEYKKVHGHCQVLRSYECADGTKLGNWVSKQRMDGSSDSEMNVMRRQALDDIGFVWQVREPSYTLDERWTDMFQRLQEYQAVYGDSLVPNGYVTKDKKRLGCWVQRQRQEWASGKLFKDLYQDRLQKLQSIGFVLRALPDDSIKSRWDRLFEQLVEYQRQHGDCVVPIKYAGNLVLGEWVRTLRRSGAALSRDHREQLDSIGFVWDVLDANWNAMFEQLRQYQPSNVPLSNDDKLGRWVYRQRRNRSKLSPDQLSKLQSIGVIQ